jgi:hypothetical protein
MIEQANRIIYRECQRLASLLVLSPPERFAYRMGRVSQDAMLNINAHAQQIALYFDGANGGTFR